MSNSDNPGAPRAPAHGKLRRFLKLMVEIDSSRFALNRVKAALMLLALLAMFGGIGYAVPALYVRFGP